MINEFALLWWRGRGAPPITSNKEREEKRSKSNSTLTHFVELNGLLFFSVVEEEERVGEEQHGRPFLDCFSLFHS